METFKLIPDRAAAKPIEARKRVTLWLYVRRGKHAITPDPDELPGGEQWFTAWHASRADAASEARIWLAERGLDAGEIVGD
jgi:hypothetical protein